MRLPSEADAACAVRETLAVEPASVLRFSTGLCHFVYDVVLGDGRRVVARIATRDTRVLLDAGVAWSSLLRPLGVPLPAVLAADVSERIIGFPFVLLERLDGVDLGVAYPRLTAEDKQCIAAEVARVQSRVHTLPTGVGFGHTTIAGLGPHSSWVAVIEAMLARTEPHLIRLGLAGASPLPRVHRRFDDLRPTLERIAPTPFLDDTTTKNVLVADGRLSGVVDVDELCYGDPLLTVGLTQMSLQVAGQDLVYIDAWADALGATVEQRARIRFYAGIFGVVFLAEQGQPFNREGTPIVDEAIVTRLLKQIDELLA